MKNNPLKKLGTFGQSIWLDYIHRHLITSGKLRHLIEEDGLRGMTSTPAIFEKAIDEELLVKKKKGEIKPSDLKGLGLRYNMWNYLKYEITVLRELCAIAWYRIRGWI